MPDFIESPAVASPASAKTDKDSAAAVLGGHELFVHPSTYLKPKEISRSMSLTPLDKEQMCGLVRLRLLAF